MSDDVVAALDAELALIEELPYRVPIHLLAKRARREIVALRARCAISDVDILLEVGRNEALEEAAKRALDLDEPIVAAAIRALKER